MSLRKTAATLALVSTLAACAGRTAVPVSPVQLTDAGLSCHALQAEVISNNTKIQQLEAEKSSRRNANIAIGVVGGLLFWPALFALNMGDAPEQEINALQQRNAGLTGLQTQNACYTTTARS